MDRSGHKATCCGLQDESGGQMMADCIGFEVGKTYRIFATDRDGRFRAKCVSRTAKTATFEAIGNGACWYMPAFTLRAGKQNLKTHDGDIPIELFVSNKPTNMFCYGVWSIACDTID